MIWMAPAEVRMGCAKGSSLGGGWSCPRRKDALHSQKRREIELVLTGSHIFSSVIKLPTPWWHPMETSLFEAARRGNLTSYSGILASFKVVTDKWTQTDIWILRGSPFRRWEQSLSSLSVCVCVRTRALRCVPTLCHPMACSSLSSSVHGIFHTSILEWVAIFYSKGSSWHRDWMHVSCVSWIGRPILYQLCQLESPS